MNFKRIQINQNGFGIIFLLDFLFVIAVVIVLAVNIFQKWENFDLFLASLKSSF